jgi:hypothetical protein
MPDAQVKFVDESIGVSGRGMITGVIFFDFGTFQFPEQEWNDAVVVILGWWLAALMNFLTGGVAETELRFMDGSFWLSIQRESGTEECRIRCIAGPVARESFQCRGSALNLLRSALGVATRVQRLCYENGWRSADLQVLDGLVSAARKLTREH